MIENELKHNYWTTIKRTRTSGRISPSVIEKTEESWKKFDDDVVSEALRIHISHYPDYKENYTLGIMRNLQRQKASGKTIKKKPSFNDFSMQRDYDFDELERMLLSN